MAIFNSSDSARQLAQAWTSETRIESLREGERPQTVDQAYDIQDSLVRELGQSRFGWKIGGSSENGIQASPIGLPSFGVLIEGYRHESSVALTLPEEGALVLEVEVALRFARDVVPAIEEFDESMIDHAFVAIEVVRSRYYDRKAAGQLSFIADDAGFHAFVGGDSLPLANAMRPIELPASLSHNGAVISQKQRGGDRTDVLHAVMLFWNHAAARGLKVVAGNVLTTGSQTYPIDVATAGTYEGAIGSSVVRLNLRER